MKELYKFDMLLQYLNTKCLVNNSYLITTFIMCVGFIYFPLMYFFIEIFTCTYPLKVQARPPQETKDWLPSVGSRGGIIEILHTLI